MEEEGALSQGIRRPLEAGKGKDMLLSQSLQKESTLLMLQF